MGFKLVFLSFSYSLKSWNTRTVCAARPGSKVYLLWFMIIISLIIWHLVILEFYLDRIPFFKMRFPCLCCIDTRVFSSKYRLG